MWKFVTFKNFAIWILLPLIIILGPVLGNYASASYGHRRSGLITKRLFAA